MYRRRPDSADEMSGGYGSQGRNNRGYRSAGGHYSGSTDRIKETNHTIMEMQNNAHIDDLSDQVRTKCVPCSWSRSIYANFKDK